jgi:putative ABC transport system ATP-binding protein
VTGIALRLEEVRRTYAGGRPDAVRALNGVSLDIPPGQFVSVEGPSGCGKTTLLNLLGLLDRPSSGRVLWDSIDVAGWPERRRTRGRLTGVGFIFQRFYLLPTLTARENVELPLTARGRPRAERLARTAELLDEVGLSSRAGAFPHELSGGEEQRVAIARSLANDPPILLADEPTGELDTSNTDQVLDLLEAVRRRHGATVVLVTHNPRVAARAERHLTLRDGEVVEDRLGA